MPDDEHDTRLLSHARPRDWQNPEPKSRYNLGAENGFVKVLVRRGTDRIVGATIVAENAGDPISEVTLAMVARVGLGKISSVIHPYPTRAEAIKKAADAYNRRRMTPRARALLQRWFAWRR